MFLYGLLLVVDTTSILHYSYTALAILIYWLTRFCITNGKRSHIFLLWIFFFKTDNKTSHVRKPAISRGSSRSSSDVVFVYFSVVSRTLFSCISFDLWNPKRTCSLSPFISSHKQTHFNVQVSHWILPKFRNPLVSTIQNELQEPQRLQLWHISITGYFSFELGALGSLCSEPRCEWLWSNWQPCSSSAHHSDCVRQNLQCNSNSE